MARSRRTNESPIHGVIGSIGVVYWATCRDDATTAARAAFENGGQFAGEEALEAPQPQGHQRQPDDEELDFMEL